MAKTERELAFVRDFDINESWTRRFADLIDKHVGFKDAENILYINAGTGDHCIAIREKTDDKIAMFATCENDELLRIARDKSVAVRADIEFPDDDPDDNSFDAVVVDERQVGGWSAVEHQVFRQGLESLGFTLVYDQQGIELYMRPR